MSRCWHPGPDRCPGRHTRCRRSASARVPNPIGNRLIQDQASFIDGDRARIGVGGRTAENQRAAQELGDGEVAGDLAGAILRGEARQAPLPMFSVLLASTPMVVAEPRVNVPSNSLLPLRLRMAPAGLGLATPVPLTASTARRAAEDDAAAGSRHSDRGRGIAGRQTVCQVHRRRWPRW